MQEPDGLRLPSWVVGQQKVLPLLHCGPETPPAMTGMLKLEREQDPPRMLLRRPSEALETSQHEVLWLAAQDSTPELVAPSFPLI